MRFLADESCDFAVVRALRSVGHEVSAIVEISPGAADEAVLALAHSEARVLLTINRKHFIRLHHHTPNHTGIIVCTFDLDFAALAQRIHDALGTQEELNGQLIRINRPG